jgi:alpha-1,3-glucosyltransferase
LLCRYTENTSEWTLDYPPFFAYFEGALAQLAARLDPTMLALQKASLQSQSVKLYLRGSVIASDAVLFCGAYWLCRCQNATCRTSRLLCLLP